MSEKKNNSNPVTVDKSTSVKSSKVDESISSASSTTAKSNLTNQASSVPTSKPITNSINPNKIEPRTDKKESNAIKWLKKGIYVLIALLLVIILTIIAVFDTDFFTQSAAWLNPFSKHQAPSTQPSQNISHTTISQPTQNTTQLQQQIQALEKQLTAQVKSKSLHQSEQDNKLSSIIELVNKHNQQQQQHLANLNKQMGQFTVLINRWKKRLADPDLLVDNIYNHLQLIQSQMALNYAPQMLAQQLEEVDKLVDELNTDELNILRLELQSLSKKLDLKSSIPIDAWLREIALAEQLIPLWLQQRQANVENNTVSLSDQPLSMPNPKQIEAVPRNDKAPNTQEASFLNTLQDFISKRIDRAFSISQKQDSVVSTSPQPQHLQTPVNFDLTNDQINRYLKERFELMRLSILSRNWDTLRQQSIEMNLWLSNHLAVAQKSFHRQLAMMSQYKPKFVNQSLSRAINILQNYQHSINRKKLSNTAVMTNNKPNSTTTIIVPKLSSPTLTNGTPTTNTSTP